MPIEDRFQVIGAPDTSADTVTVTPIGTKVPVTGPFPPGDGSGGVPPANELCTHVVIG